MKQQFFLFFFYLNASTLNNTDTVRPCSRRFMVCTCSSWNSHLLGINNAKQMTLHLTRLLIVANNEQSTLSY